MRPKASPWGEAVKNLRFLTDEGVKALVIAPHPALRATFPQGGRFRQTEI